MALLHCNQLLPSQKNGVLNLFFKERLGHFFVFSINILYLIQLIVNKIADGGIRTVYLRYWNPLPAEP